MTIRRTFTCDAPGCGVETNGEWHIALPYEMRRPDVEFVPDYLHGCTKEHLGLAVATQFGIPIDATAERVMQLETKLADAERVARARLTEVQSTNQAYELCAKERSALEERFAELEAQLAKQAPIVDATGKTPVEVNFYGFYASNEPAADQWNTHTPDHNKRQWEAGAKAVLDVFGNQRAVEALLALENRITQDGHRIFTGSKEAVEAIDVAAAMVRAELAKLGANDESAETSAGKGEQGFVKARYEALTHEALFDAYVRPLVQMGFVIQRPRSVHWGMVTDVIRAAIDALVEPHAS